jgi:putative ATPase
MSKGENADSLHRAVFNTLKTAEKLKCTSIAIPAISSGIFGFPKPLCAKMFLTAIQDFSTTKPKHLVDIRLTNFDSETTHTFRDTFYRNN